MRHKGTVVPTPLTDHFCIFDTSLSFISHKSSNDDTKKKKTPRLERIVLVQKRRSRGTRDLHDLYHFPLLILQSCTITSSSSTTTYITTRHNKQTIVTCTTISNQKRRVGTNVRVLSVLRSRLSRVRRIFQG